MAGAERRAPTRAPVFITADSLPLFTPWFASVVGREIAISISTHQRSSIAVYIGASNGDMEEFFDLFVVAVQGINQRCNQLSQALTPRHLRIDSHTLANDVHMVAEEAAFVLLAGGDAQLGWQAMDACGLDSALVTAADAGAVLLGVSAGAAQLGTHAFHGANDAVVAPFATLGLGGFCIGTHEEADGWASARQALAHLDSLQTARQVLQGEPESEAVVLGVPKGGCAALHPDGSVEPFLKPITLLRSSAAAGTYPSLAAGQRHESPFATACAVFATTAKAVSRPSTRGFEVVRKLPIPNPNSQRPPKTIRCVCISDTHNQHAKLDVPDGDILIHTGDFCDCGSLAELDDFCAWIDRLPHASKVVVAGNHDWCLDEATCDEVRRDARTRSRAPPGMTSRARTRLSQSVNYLEDSGCTIDGLTFWGSPYQPEFEGAFNKPRARICPQPAPLMMSACTPKHPRALEC